MKILMVPFSAMADTAGSFYRVNAIIEILLEKNIEVAMCAGRDLNYKNPYHVKSYDLPVPSPLGLPKCIGKHMLQFASKSGIAAHKTIRSFDEILYLTGAISKRYFAEQVNVIGKVIREFQPDYVYSEFNLAAIVAAKMEEVSCLADYSYPVQHEYAHNRKYAKGVNSFLLKNNLLQIESVLQIFEWADKLIVPSHKCLEPIQKENLIFTGPFGKKKFTNPSVKRNKILAYMGNGCISSSKLQKVMVECAKYLEKEFYIAVPGSKPMEHKNLHIGPWFDFNEIMEDALVYIHHGGQNGCMAALIAGTPQIICSGEMFERKYNAESICKVGAGIMLEQREFTTERIIECVSKIEKNEMYRENARKMGLELQELGGTVRIVEYIKK